MERHFYYASENNPLMNTSHMHREYHSLKEAIIHGSADFPVGNYAFGIVSDTEVRTHWHDEVELIIPGANGLILQSEEDKFILERDCPYFVNSKALHRIYRDTDSPIPAGLKKFPVRVLTFHLSLLDRDRKKSSQAPGKSNDQWISKLADGELQLPTQIPKESVYFIELRDLCLKLLHLMREKEAGYEIITQGLLYLLIGYMGRAGLFRRTSESFNINHHFNKRFRDTISYLRKNFHRNISVDELAAHSGVSVSQFCRFFKKMTNSRSREYINALRIAEAARQLKSSDAPIIDICHGCGFESLSYFIKCFREIKGIPPARFRKTGG